MLNSLQANIEDPLIPYTLIPIDVKCPDSSTSGMYNVCIRVDKRYQSMHLFIIIHVYYLSSFLPDVLHYDCHNIQVTVTQ